MDDQHTNLDGNSDGARDQTKVVRAGHSGGDQPPQVSDVNVEPRLYDAGAGAPRQDAAHEVLRAGGELVRQTHEAAQETAGQAREEQARQFQSAARAARAAVRTGTAVQDAAQEWVRFSYRTLLRNAASAGDLMTCRSLPCVLGWQGNLLRATAEDWIGTAFAAQAAFTRRSPRV